MLEAVNADADRVTRLMTDLLDVSRIDAGRLRASPAGGRRAGRGRAGSIAGRVASGEPRDRFALAVGRRPAGDLARPGQDRAGPRQPDRERGPARRRHGRPSRSRQPDAGWLGRGGVTVADEGAGIPPEPGPDLLPLLARRAAPAAPGWGSTSSRASSRRTAARRVDAAPGGGARVPGVSCPPARPTAAVSVPDRRSAELPPDDQLGLGAPPVPALSSESRTAIRPRAGRRPWPADALDAAVREAEKALRRHGRGRGALTSSAEAGARCGDRSPLGWPAARSARCRPGRGPTPAAGSTRRSPRRRPRTTRGWRR